MFELVVPSVDEGQQYTLSQYSRSQKSTAGGQRPGVPVGRTGRDLSYYYFVFSVAIAVGIQKY